jgi:hypothetical protein
MLAKAIDKRKAMLCIRFPCTSPFSRGRRGGVLNGKQPELARQPDNGEVEREQISCARVV